MILLIRNTFITKDGSNDIIVVYYIKRYFKPTITVFTIICWFSLINTEIFRVYVTVTESVIHIDSIITLTSIAHDNDN